jgi:iron complex outermembrane recepter protein
MRSKTFSATTASSIAIGFAVLATPAFAQSTGTQDFDKEIVVTGTRNTTQAVAGISAPDTAKAKAVLTQENIERQNPGQTILDTINQVPGVSFQNNDAYGSSGGTLNIRGFSSDRVSLTFDGVPLNDSGNYAIYSNQQIDPELIEQVNVNLGTTDVDSPTASAAGGTVNLRTKKPDRDFGAMLSGSAGEFNFFRMFAKIETGDITEGGIRAWFSASTAMNDNPFNNYGKVDKQQFNGKLYIPLAGDDFISIAGHYNRNRNNFFGSLPLRNDAGRVVGSGTGNRFPANNTEREYLINYPCQTNSVARAGLADAANTCGTEFDRRYNPSDTGNIRISSRFSLSDSLTLTVDPSFQYVSANGGGTVTGREGLRDIDPGAGTTNIAGYFGGSPFFGRDLNGDGDLLDTVTVLAPSQTQTNRYGVIAGLRWEMSEDHTFRLNYTFDRARHRQTGEVGAVGPDGEPNDVFPVNAGLADVGGFILQKRDRLSYATLHQVSAEYRGEYMDGRLEVTAGVRAPFFKRDLTNNCFTSSANGFVECFGGNTAGVTSATTLNPYVATTNATTGALAISGWATPQNRVLKYSKVLPNVGFVFDVADNASVFGNFSQGLSVPGTDNLYNAFYFPVGTARAKPAPETTNNYDLGVRYRSNMVQAQLSVFYNQFQNRLASAYDPELDRSVYRNLGDVKKYGIDGSLAITPVDNISLYLFGSLLKSEIKDNLVIGENRDGSQILALTAGKREAGAPKYTFGGTIRGNFGPVDIGITAKRTGERFIYDTNEATFTGSAIASGVKVCTSATPPVCTTPAAIGPATQIFGPTAPAYWQVNLDARVSLEFLGLNDKTFVQFNVYNLFDQFYVGGFSGNLNQPLGTPSTTTGVSTYGAPGFVQIGAPRTISGTVVFAF